MCVQNIYILFLDKPGTTEYSKTKTCDACVSYMCTVDGKRIMYGNGCFEDFDKTCGNIATIDKNVIKDNLNNSFHYGKNFVAASCSHDDNCAEAELERYTYINKEAYETFTNNIDKSYGQSCEYRPLTMPEQINSAAQISMKLFGIILSGIILFYVW
uniref:Uncharacterized protein n=1 Tax=Panagrolaimus davidi TaxID=227884 RepID=A0A914PS04_9BILA